MAKSITTRIGSDLSLGGQQAEADPLLEKAFYEIEYEFTNRPDWAHIPLDATLRILEQRHVIAPAGAPIGEAS